MRRSPRRFDEATVLDSFRDLRLFLDSGVFKSLFLTVLALAVISWLGYVVYSPHERLSREEKAKLSAARIVTVGKLYEYLVSTTNAGSDLENALEADVAEASADRESTGGTVKPPLKIDPNVGSRVIRIDPRGASNVIIYIRRSDFEIVPYPDRGDFVKSVGKAWCENSGDAHWYLPTLYFEDIRTGEELASYNCVHWSDVF